MGRTHPMYVCDSCGYARYHPIQYCPKCPGRLTKKEIPHPDSLKAEGGCAVWLKKQGLDYSWQECEISPVMVLVLRYNRLRELASFCNRMSIRPIGRERTPDENAWHKRQLLAGEAAKKIRFLIAKVEVPDEITDESWDVYKPFRETRKERQTRIDSEDDA